MYPNSVAAIPPLPSFRFIEPAGRAGPGRDERLEELDERAESVVQLGDEVVLGTAEQELKQAPGYPSSPPRTSGSACR